MTNKYLARYAQFQAIFNFYSENETKKSLRVLHEGRPMQSVIGETLGTNTWCKVDATDSTDERLLPASGVPPSPPRVRPTVIQTTQTQYQEVERHQDADDEGMDKLVEQEKRRRHQSREC